MLRNECPKRVGEFDGESGGPPVRVRMFSALKEWSKVHPMYWHSLALPHDVPTNAANVHQRRVLVDPLTVFRLYERPMERVHEEEGDIVSVTCAPRSFDDVVEVPTWLYSISDT